MSKKGEYACGKEQAYLRIRCREAGLTFEQAASICGVSVPALYKWYLRHGFCNKLGTEGAITYKRSIPQKIGEEIVDMRCKGFSFREIAGLSGFSRQTVTKYLRDMGYK